MIRTEVLRDVFDLTDPGRSAILNMAIDEARRRVGSGDVRAVREIEGHFALVAREGSTVRLARSLQMPLRYFIAKRADGPALIAADRIDTIRDWLVGSGLGDQFHPSYTRMVPAHYVTEVALVGCPDPNPTYRRYFTPRRGALPPDLDAIGTAYIGALYQEIVKRIERIPDDEPIGVCFSGGIDSGAVFLATYHALLTLGKNPARLKAFTLAVGAGDDLEQAGRFLDALGLRLFLEPIDVTEDAVDVRRAVEVVEDYKALDVQAAAVQLALCAGIRDRYPQWKYLLDGDGGDENLKDYPIEENPELTIRSVLNNPLLYHEGWGVDAIKHSLTFTGGLSRGCTRGYAPAVRYGFASYSPFMLANVIEVAEGIPFVELCGWDHERLYALKGEVVARGINAVTGLTMPVFPKRRFQVGAGRGTSLARRFPAEAGAYRRLFDGMYHG